jgi:hypothetical protein
MTPHQIELPTIDFQVSVLTVLLHRLERNATRRIKTHRYTAAQVYREIEGVRAAIETLRGRVAA